METRLWTRNFILVTVASTLGSAGAIAGGFALSFLVFDETGSTLASALIIAIQLVPYVILPLLVAPLMDRLPRKAFLVGGDIANGLAYLALGLWLVFMGFSYAGYLAISVLLACLGSIDELAFTSIYPEIIPQGAEQKGYSVSSMLYPVLKIIMMPAAAVMLDTVGVPMLLMGQGALSLLAALTESFISVEEHGREQSEGYSFETWRSDIREAAAYLKDEQGLFSLFSYMAITNGVAAGYTPILIAFFRTAPGFTATMYSFFSVVEFAGRTIGSAFQYRVDIPKKRRFLLVFFVYQLYETMDMLLLWLPYPLMLVNRGLCGFFGANSAILRSAAVQRYIPEQLRSRVNAANGMMLTAAESLLTLAIGVLGELMDYRICMAVCGAVAMAACWILVWGRRHAVRAIFEAEDAATA